VLPVNRMRIREKARSAGRGTAHPTNRATERRGAARMRARTCVTGATGTSLSGRQAGLIRTGELLLNSVTALVAGVQPETGHETAAAWMLARQSGERCRFYSYESARVSGAASGFSVARDGRTDEPECTLGMHVELL
jgi:hypothetical protein